MLQEVTKPALPIFILPTVSSMVDRPSTEVGRVEDVARSSVRRGLGVFWAVGVTARSEDRSLLNSRGDAELVGSPSS
jgi:hypothetical protein